MDDLISRQQAIDALNDEYHGMISDESMKIYQIINWLDELPSAQPEKRTDKRTETHACDLISRQAAIDALTGWETEPTDAYYPSWYVEKIKELPSAEPQIIRCKDCKHYKFADNRAFGFPVKRCEWTGFEDVDDDDFCSRAERMEVDNEQVN